MKAYQAFYFENYEWDAGAREVRLNYSFDREMRLTETVRFDFEYADGYSAEALDRVLRGLWLAGGVSYYKAAMPGQIVVEGDALADSEAEFFSTLYRLGLGQLCYENKLSLDRVARFAGGGVGAIAVGGLGAGGDLLALGGGKDSLTSAAVLEASGRDFTTFSAVYAAGAAQALVQQGEQLGRPHLNIRREFDPNLHALTREGGYNGHVPVTAIMMFIGLAAAVLSGARQVIFSDESSAGEGNVVYEGVEINHQYSKSLDFERLMQKYVAQHVSPDLNVFSLLRPLGELAIAQLFAQGPFDRFATRFTSCNRSFKHGSAGFMWCGECPKCAFVFLALAPFVSKARLVTLWGENLLEKPELEQAYRELLGLTGHKPFECVGEIEECRQAVRMVTDNYPEVKRFGVPAGEFDWRQWHEDAMPDEYRKLLKSFVGRNA